MRYQKLMQIEFVPSSMIGYCWNYGINNKQNKH